jgi:hypothetical protein
LSSEDELGAWLPLLLEPHAEAPMTSPIARSGGNTRESLALMSVILSGSWRPAWVRRTTPAPEDPAMVGTGKDKCSSD